MILEKQTESHILEEGQTQESIGMSLDLDSAQILMQMLSKNLYSDSIGSTVRECASNALDSHRRAGIDKPIIVSFSVNKDNNYEFSVEDFGIGLDADDVRNIISKYGKSTKRNSTTELGMMGLGFKAPLAYSSSFYFICRKDGMERKYMMYEGEDVNTIDLLYETTTTECNGVKVIVPVKWGDKYDFKTKIKEQLAYFESVYFNTEDINNDFLIHRNEIFQFSEISNDRNLHICLDNVYYPLDFDKLGIKRIEIPVGLKFSLTDGIFPTPNRESIRYTQESKKIVTDKLAELADYMVNKYNESITEAADIISVFKYYEGGSKKVTILNKSCEIDTLLQFAKVKLKTPKVPNVKLINIERLHKHRDYILGEYEVKYYLNNNVMKDCKNKYWESRLHLSNINSKNYYTYDSVIGGNKKLYMKSIFPGNEKFYFLKQKITHKLGGRLSNDGFETYFEILDLHIHPKSEWRERIKEFEYIKSLFTSKFLSVEDVNIPQQWLDSRKKVKIGSVSTGRTDVDGKRIIKLQGEIVGKLAEPLQRYVDGKNCKFTPVVYKLEDIHKLHNLTIYDSHENSLNLDRLYELSNKQPIKFLTLSQRELNVLEKVEIHNLIPYTTFMEGKNKPFKRLVTSYLINELMYAHRHVFTKSACLKHISTDLYNKVAELDAYKSKHYNTGSTNMYVAMLEVANANNLFDEEIYHTYLNLKTILEKLPFVNVIMEKVSNYYSINDPLIEVLTDMFKYYKFRIDYTKYNIKLEEELVN